MIRLLKIVILAVIVFISACSSSSTDSGLTKTLDKSTTVDASVNNQPHSTEPKQVDPELKAAIFIAAVEETVNDTELSGSIESNLDELLLSGYEMCVDIEQGISQNQIIKSYMAQSGDDSEINLKLASAIYGASKEALC